MRIGVPDEGARGETRVALVPAVIRQLVEKGHEVVVASGAGERALIPDEAFEASGAQVVVRDQVVGQVDVLVRVSPPGPEEVADLKEGAAFIGFMAPLANRDLIDVFLKRHTLSFDMGFVPRITRAQSMDALSSMATIAGYRAVIVAADRMRRMFPLMMTAAGTVSPANVLVLGAGVAGLSAIATARRLGAKVNAFDPRKAVAEQVRSLGAGFIDMPVTEDVETEGGYAKEQSDAFLDAERQAIGASLHRVDVVITTAQVFGKEPPKLITGEMVDTMRPGSVIVDLAAETGGNCTETRAGEWVTRNDVEIFGAVNLPADLPVHASQLYARNVFNLFENIFGEGAPDFEDEITNGACITRDGELVHGFLGKMLGMEGSDE